MFKYILLILFSTTALASPDALKLLELSDKYRSPYEYLKTDIAIDDYKNEKLRKTIKYQVYYRDGESLIDVKSGVNKGNRILLSKKGMFVTVKRSARAVRITPIQRILGQASYGDLAGLKLSKDYNASYLKQEQNAIQLQLTAKNKQATYTKIILWINPSDYRPIKADAYLASGKLFKQLLYKITNNQISEIIYTSPNSKNKKTIMRFLSFSSKKLPKRFFSSNSMRSKIR